MSNYLEAAKSAAALLESEDRRATDAAAATQHSSALRNIPMLAAAPSLKKSMSMMWLPMS